jgi:GT2 family glycosyltransferase
VGHDAAVSDNGEALAATPDPRVAVVQIVHDQREELLRSLGHLSALPERPQLIVVDNASTDGSAEAVRERFPSVDMIRLPVNLGVAARDVGVEFACAAYVALSDDDSWWEPGSLARAADALDAHPRLAVVQAHVYVGEEDPSRRREEPMMAEIADSPLPDEPGMPGRPVVSFLGPAAVVRRSAYLAAGGTDPRLQMGGEEEHLSADLQAAGWSLAYLAEVVAHHRSMKGRSGAARDLRRRRGVRNTLWFSWLRRPWPSAARRTLMMVRKVPKDRVSALAFLDALRGLPWVLRERRVVPAHVERRLRLMDEPQMGSRARSYDV